MVILVLLGAVEPSVSPCFSLIAGLWYLREEQPLSHALCFLGNSFVTMFGGLLAYAIAHIQGALTPWKVYIQFSRRVFMADVQTRTTATFLRCQVGAGRLPSFEDQKSLPYIEAIITEMLRWLPLLLIGFPHIGTRSNPNCNRSLVFSPIWSPSRSRSPLAVRNMPS